MENPRRFQFCHRKRLVFSSEKLFFNEKSHFPMGYSLFSIKIVLFRFRSFFFFENRILLIKNRNFLTKTIFCIVITATRGRGRGGPGAKGGAGGRGGGAAAGGSSWQGNFQKNALYRYSTDGRGVIRDMEAISMNIPKNAKKTTK